MYPFLATIVGLCCIMGAISILCVLFYCGGKLGKFINRDNNDWNREQNVGVGCFVIFLIIIVMIASYYLGNNIIKSNNKEQLKAEKEN